MRTRTSTHACRRVHPAACLRVGTAPRHAAPVSLGLAGLSGPVYSRTLAAHTQPAVPIGMPLPLRAADASRRNGKGRGRRGYSARTDRCAGVVARACGRTEGELGTVSTPRAPLEYPLE